jgi:hypothetical protein
VPLTVSQAHSRPSSIFVDEFNASGFESPPNNIKGCASWLTRPGFQLVHGYDPNSGFIREILLVPRKKAPCCPGLFRRDHQAVFRANE